MPARDVARASNILIGMGWRPDCEPTEDLFRFRHDNAFYGPRGGEFELHSRTFHEFADPRADDEFRSTAVPFEFLERQVRIPDATPMLLHTIVHGVRWNPEPPIRWIADALTILRVSGTEIKWQEIVAFAHRWQLTYRLGLGVSYLTRYFAAPIASDVVAELVRRRLLTAVERIEALSFLRNETELVRNPLGSILYVIARYVRFAAEQNPVRAAALFRASASSLLVAQAAPKPWATLRNASYGKSMSEAPDTTRRGARSDFWSRFGLPDHTGRTLLTRYFGDRLRGLFGYAIIAAFQSLLVLPTLWLFARVFDAAIPHRDLMLLIEIAAAIVVIRAASSAIAILFRLYVVRLIKSAVSRLREDLLAGTYRRSHQEMSGSDLDRLHSRIVQDTERIDNVCNALLSGMFPAAISIIVLLVLLAYVSWQLTLVGAFTLPLVSLLSRGARTRLQGEVARCQTDYDIFSKGVSFVLRQMELTRVQAFEMGERYRQRRTLKALASSGVRMSMAYALHDQLQMTIAGIAGVALLVLGGNEVIEGRMTLGSLAEFYFGAGMLYSFVGSYLGGAADVAGGRQAIANVAELLDAEVPEPYGGSREN